MLNAGPSSLRVVRKPAGRIRQAVRDNNVALLSRMQHKADLRNTDRNRLTSLAWAAIEGSLEVFEWLLLDYGHDDQELSRDAESNTVFHLLASVPSQPNRLVRPTPEFPARPTTRTDAESTELALRMMEIYHTLFPFLVDWSNSGGKTALHIAAECGHAACVALLCALGADADLPDLQGNTPLHYAAAWGELECARALLEHGCAASARNYEGFTPADYAFSDAVRRGMDGIARDVREFRRALRVCRPLPPGSDGQQTARPPPLLKSPSVPYAAAVQPGAAAMRRANSAQTAESSSRRDGSGSIYSAHSSVRL